MLSDAEAFIEPTVELLAPLLPSLTFFGGAAVGLLITDPAAPVIRNTIDVDVIVAVATISGFAQIEEQLRSIGFGPDPELRCRYRKGSLILDILPAAQEVGSSWNQWLPVAVDTATNHVLVHTAESRTIRLVHPAVFIALKLEAFQDRGKDDLLMSHDMEDILSVVDGRAGLAQEIADGPAQVAEFIRKQFSALLEHKDFEYAMEGMLSRDEVGVTRLKKLAARMRLIADGQVEEPSSPPQEKTPAS